MAMSNPNVGWYNCHRVNSCVITIDSGGSHKFDDVCTYHLCVRPHYVIKILVQLQSVRVCNLVRQLRETALSAMMLPAVTRAADKVILQREQVSCSAGHPNPAASSPISVRVALPETSLRAALPALRRSARLHVVLNPRDFSLKTSSHNFGMT